MSSPKKPSDSEERSVDQLVDRASSRTQRRIDKAAELVKKILEDELDDDTSFEDYERAAVEIVNEIARRELEKKLQGIADGHPDAMTIDHNNDWHGIREGTAFDYSKHQPGTVTYHSLVGGLRVTRYSYRECHRNGAIYIPLELDAGIIERLTPGLARCVARGFADMPMRRFEQLLRSAGCRPPSRSTLERSARDIGSYAMAANAEIEPLVRAQEQVPAEAERIVLGLDRTAVPMRKGQTGLGYDYVLPDLRRPRPRPEPGSGHGNVCWKMDYVGTFSFVDGDGEVLVTRQYRLPSDVEPEHITDRMMADVRRALSQRPKLSVVVVQDGAPELWQAVRHALRKKTCVKAWVEVLDWYHLDERLSRCLDLCNLGSTRKATRGRWHRKLLESSGGTASVLASLRRYQRGMGPLDSKELDGHISYIGRQRKRTGYASFRKKGVPIGSGPTEGACKSLVAARAKRSGQRWSQRGITAALHLRSIHQSDRFNAFWPIFASRYRATSLAPN